jgi:hypothetical protein
MTKEAQNPNEEALELSAVLEFRIGRVSFFGFHWGFIILVSFVIRILSHGIASTN